jgi:hypothetical protein
MVLNSFLLILVFAFNSSLVFAEAIIRVVHSPTEAIVETHGTEGFYSGKRVLILSKRYDKIIAIGKVSDDQVNDEVGVIKVRIEEIVDNFMIVPGDKVELLNFHMYQQKKIPGFFSITLKGNKDTPSRYKDLVYFGVFTSEGHTLAAQEFLVSPFQFQYGVTDKFGVRIVNALWLDGYANAGAKFQVLRNKHAKITVNALGAYKLQAQDWIAQLGGVVTIPSSSKFQSHFMVNIMLDPQYSDANATKGLGLYQESDIRSITEYITSSWNRVLYGPVYNVELETLGGTVSHMWIWNTFHMSLGLATKDFSNMTIGTKGYYYVYDLFWRF